MVSITREKLESLLSTGNYDITFIKLNGEIRRMSCTRNFDFIANNSINWSPPKGIRSPGRNQIIVWDIEKNSWRSFRLQSIVSIAQSTLKLEDSDLSGKNSSLDIKAKLSSGVYILKYWTLAGVVKTTVGTRDYKLVDDLTSTIESDKPKRRIPEHQIIYWDFNANGFRSFRSEALIGMTEISKELKSGINTNIMMTKVEVQRMLDEGVCDVTFIKRDGTIRDMTCTSNWNLVKRLSNNWYDFEGTKYNHLFLVWDIVKDDYRNIRFDSILSINRNINYE